MENICEQEQFDKKMSIIRSEKLEKEGLKKLEDNMYKKIGGRIRTYDWDYYIEEYLKKQPTWLLFLFIAY